MALDGLEEVEEEGSDDEIEYMPPRAVGEYPPSVCLQRLSLELVYIWSVALPWEPAWAQPDLKPMMTILANLPSLWALHDEEVSIQLPELEVKEEPRTNIRLCGQS